MQTATSTSAEVPARIVGPSGISIEMIAPPNCIRITASFGELLLEGCVLRIGDKSGSDALEKLAELIARHGPTAIAQAEGDAQRFRAVLAEYQKAPAVTRDRLYLETMQQVYSNVTKVMVDSRSGSNLLYLPLDRLLQQSGASTGAAAGGVTVVPPPASTESSAPQSVDIRSRDNARTRDREGR